MNEIDQEIQRVLDGAQMAPLVYDMALSRFDDTTIDLCIKYDDKIPESLLSSKITPRMHVKRSAESGKTVVEFDSQDRLRVRYDMVTDMRDFITHFSPASNPKLTNLYKWYNNLQKQYNFYTKFLTPSDLTAFENSIYKTYKYIYQSNIDQNKLKTHATNILAILELIKTRYEDKMGVLS